MKILKSLFSRASEDVAPFERLALQKAKSFDSRHPRFINFILIAEAILAFGIILFN